jgi:hypothetical protein
MNIFTKNIYFLEFKKHTTCTDRRYIYTLVDISNCYKQAEKRERQNDNEIFAA